MSDVVEVYQDKLGQWRWHRKAPNGRVLADSAEGYTHRSDCLDMAHRVNGDDARYELRDTPDQETLDLE